jgi:hypothetical protein
MTPQERMTYIDVALRMSNIDIHKVLLEKILSIVDLVDRKKGNASIKDVIEIDKN